MKFESKTDLAEHIKQLEKNGYLKSKWIVEYYKRKTQAIKYYKVNFTKEG